MASSHRDKRGQGGPGRPPARPRQDSPHPRLALRLALIYAVVAALWIMLSDSALGWMGLPLEVEREISSLKGLGFVLVTATVLYIFANLYSKRLQASQERYWRLFENATEGITVLRVERDERGALRDLVVTDVNPAQAARTHAKQDEMVGRRMSRQHGPDERLRSYFDLTASGVAAGRSVTSELRVAAEDAHELLTAYPIECDLWVISALDISETRRAEEALRHEDERIREAYVDVLDAVTGGKLILLTEEELVAELGAPLCIPSQIASPEQMTEARRVVTEAARAEFPAWDGSHTLLSSACEALNNAIKHGHGGTYQVYAKDGRLQVAVIDEGPGIDFRTLPKAALVPGFSTAASLGMGFTIMLQLCDRVLLSTRPGRTEIVLEVGVGSEADVLAAVSAR